MGSLQGSWFGGIGWAAVEHPADRRGYAAALVLGATQELTAREACRGVARRRGRLDSPAGSARRRAANPRGSTADRLCPWITSSAALLAHCARPPRSRRGWRRLVSTVVPMLITMMSSSGRSKTVRASTMASMDGLFAHTPPSTRRRPRKGWAGKKVGARPCSREQRQPCAHVRRGEGARRAGFGTGGYRRCRGHRRESTGGSGSPQASDPPGPLVAPWSAPPGCTCSERVAEALERDDPKKSRGRGRRRSRVARPESAQRRARAR